MNIRMVTYSDAVGLVSRGAPYYAFDQALEGTGPYRPADYIEFMVIVSGEGMRISAGPDGSLVARPLLPGEFYVFPPGEVHEIYSTSTETMREFNLAFPATTWVRFVEMAELDIGWTTRPPAPLAVVDVKSPEIAEPFRRAAERFHGGVATEFALLEFLTAIVPLITPAHPVETRAGGPPWLRDVLQAMTREDDLRGGVARLAELARVSPTHLWRTLRRYTGLSPTEFVRAMQMRHAATLLTSSDASVGSIAERCGFANTSHFSQVFRQHHGVTPRGHRAAHRVTETVE